MASDIDVLAQLRTLQWGGLSIPCMHMHTGFDHDIKEHKVWGKDGAQLEGTGRNIIKTTATVPFRNNVSPAPGETWNPLPLYPIGMRAFFRKVADRKNDILVHPEFGEILCKVKSIGLTHKPDVRDGVDVDVEWWQTNGDPDAPDPINSPSGGRIGSLAADLDAITETDIDKLRAYITLPPFTPDLGEILREIGGLADTVTILSRNASGKLDQVAFRVNNLADSMNGAALTVDSSARSASTLAWPIKNAAIRIAVDIETRQAQLAAAGRGVLVYLVTMNMTLANIAAALNRSSSEIMRMNPLLLRQAYVPVGTVVRYLDKPNR